MLRAQICVEMKWTEQEYNSQRWEFIESIINEFKQRNIEAKQASSRH